MLNNIMGRHSKMKVFITKPLDVANYFNKYFVEKVNKLWCNMGMVNNCNSCTLIDNYIMETIDCTKVTAS